MNKNTLQILSVHKFLAITDYKKVSRFYEVMTSEFYHNISSETTI